MPSTIIHRLTSLCVLGLVLSGTALADDAVTTKTHPARRGEYASRTSSSGSSSSSSYWLGMGGIAVALAVFGAYRLASKKVRPASDSTALRVIGRTSLSPRQAVYLVRVGDRTLIVGTGSQGPPSLLGELDETPAPSLHETAVKAPHLATRSPIGGTS